MKALAFRSERASRRAERVAKEASTPAQPASAVFDPIDVQIASLLESVASDEAQAVVREPERPRVAPVAPARKQKPKAKATSRAKATAQAPRKPKRAPNKRTRALRRPDRYAGRDALAGIAVGLPRPYLPYTVKMTFAWMAVIVLSLAFGLLIVYLMSP